MAIIERKIVSSMGVIKLLMKAFSLGPKLGYYQKSWTT